ncbi:MAG: indolepyruvate ferredoxin oxidoreductase subunit beta [Actinomycetia bacterium]|nr:indolepyruvate ferredoxin oxidoreductase subunit beta [Actinomycetes bacterium]MCP4222357.1 indolepyruvate ferredoxin oxidoreductase subunit beta [Actinomycetes bacterium]MCP5033045.1 indolepyruvate ferredoxin oxidoreductase subunit beta [Actinomycetes bacterium]
MSATCPVVIVGVGGQGVISLARVLGLAAVTAGLEARVGQIYGLSQRGGSVEATVRFGEGSTTFIAQGEAEVIVGLEPIEAERAISKMSSDATVLINKTPIVPIGLTRSGEAYPTLSSIVSRIDDIAGRVHLVDGTTLALEAGDTKLLNTVMIGVLAGSDLLPIPADHLEAAVDRANPGGRLEASRRAFRLGQQLGEVACR